MKGFARRRPWVALIHADGKLPNLALMRLGAHFRARGFSVRLFRAGQKRPTSSPLAFVFGSSIFEFSAPTRAVLEREWGAITWGGTGVRVESSLLEVALRDWDELRPDYSLYPEFQHSLGFTQRGCRLKCKFCVVPRKEGKPKSVDTIRGVWRGPGHPKKIVLLDNDFFGQPREEWLARIAEIRGDPRRADPPRKGMKSEFRVCLSQGINVRMIDEESAAAVALIEYRDNEFSARRLYVAWDNLKDEGIFKKGVSLLEAAGVPPKHVMSYMLLGYRPEETWEEITYRFDELVALGCLPYPMVYGRERALPPEKGGHPDPEVRAHVKRLLQFARWATTHLYKSVAWSDYDPKFKSNRTARAKAAVS